MEDSLNVTTTEYLSINCTILDKCNLNRFYPLLTLCSIAFIGNALNLIVCSAHHMSAVIFIFIRCNIVSDIFIIVCHFIITIDRDWSEEVFYQSYSGTFLIVHLFEYSNETFLGISNLLTLAISIERFLAICRPLLTKRFKNKTTAVLFCTLIWLFSFLFHLPMVFANYIDDCRLRKRFDVPYCYFRDDDYRGNVGYKVFRFLREILMRLLPTVSIMVLNIITVVTYRKQHSRRKNMVATNVKEERYLMIFLIVVLFDFFTSAIPGIVLNMYDQIVEWNTSMFDVTRVFEICGFGLTFFLNMACNRTFRYTFCKLFLRSNKYDKYLIKNKLIRNYSSSTSSKTTSISNN